MKRKQIVVLSLILCALILGVFLKKSFQMRAHTVISGTQPANKTTLAFEQSKVAKILLGRGEKAPAVDLEKQNEVWRIRSLWSAKADQEKAEGFLNKLKALRGEFRSSGKELFRDFGIGDEEAVFVKLMDAQGGLLLDMRLGTKADVYSGCFFRLASKDEIYLADVSIADLLGVHMPLAETEISANYWTDLKPFKIDPERILSIAVKHLEENGGKKATLGIKRAEAGKSPTESSWVFVKSKNSENVIDRDKILRFIVALNNVQAQAVVEPNGKYGLDRPVMIFTLREEGRAEAVVNVSAKSSQEDVFFVKSNTHFGVFKIPGHFLQDLELRDEQLLKDATDVDASPQKP